MLSPACSANRRPACRRSQPSLRWLRKHTSAESDTRNCYDLIAARQAIDLRPKLERLDQLLLRSAGVDPGALSFEFRPLWQMDAAASAAIALQKAQATQIYAGLNLWPAAVTAKLVEAQLAEDGTYPGAEEIFAEATPASQPTADFDPAQPRDPDGRWTNGGGAQASGLISSPLSIKPSKPESPNIVGGVLNFINPIGTASAQEIEPEEENRGQEPLVDPAAEARIERYANARSALKEIDPYNSELTKIGRPDCVPTEQDIASIEAAARTALAAKADSGPPSEGLPANPAANGRLEPSPPGLVITVRGNTTTEVGDSYSEQVREFYGASRVPNSNKSGATVPDGLFIERQSDGISAIEVKYVGNWSKSPYNSDPKELYASQAVDKTVQQALKYAKAYPTGVRWVTNSSEFAAAYTERFLEAGVKNFSFVVIPALRERRDGAYFD